MAALGGWWVRAPAIEHGAVVAPHEIDIDPPSMRAQREATIALATMPDDPWSFAESLAASAPAKGAERDKEDCGQADAPEFADIDSTAQGVVMTRGATPRYLGVQARMDAALRASADPFDRAVADFMNAGDLRSPSGSEEAVVQQAAGSTDPRLVSLGHAVCARMPDGGAGCAALTAERWAQVDAGNGMPWIEILGQAQARGDTAGVRDAMSHLAAATRFDTHFYAVPGAVARRMPADGRDLAAGNELVVGAMGRSAAFQFPSFKPLLDICRNEAGGDEQRALQCIAISDSLYAHSDNSLQFLMSGALLFQTTGDASRRESIKAERMIFAAHWSPATGLSRCGTLRDEVRKIARNAEIGDVEAMREDARKFVTP